MVFDLIYLEIDHNNFPKQDLDHFLWQYQRMHPTRHANTTRQRSSPLYMDSDYAGDGSNGWSRTGFFLFLNNSLICWHSKKQSRIENSVFDSELIALKTGFKTVQGVCYKLQMMGLPLETTAYTYGNNKHQ